MSAVICRPPARAASTVAMTVSSLGQLAWPVALRWKISAPQPARRAMLSSSSTASTKRSPSLRRWEM